MRGLKTNPCSYYPKERAEMAYLPGQGKSGPFLMQLWRRYLEEYADREADVSAQAVVGGYHAVEIFGFLSRELDRDGKYGALIEKRLGYFEEGKRRAGDFDDSLLTATFSLYNHFNTLARQFASRNSEAERLISQIDEQVHARVVAADAGERCAAAVEALFPLLSLMTLILDQESKATGVIRNIEQRYKAGAERASSGWDRMINALYRVVEMMQIFVMLSDSDLKEQVQQIAARFQEEDGNEARLKLRNGLCRLFELGHLLANHLDSVL